MSDLDKVLEYIDENMYVGEEVKCLINFINHLKNPPKKLIWQSRTKTFPDWKNITDEEYELFQHLSRYEFRQIEL